MTNDFLSKALGEDKGVRITGLGYGVTRKKIAANAHYKLIIKECQENCKAMNDRLVMLEVRIFYVNSLVLDFLIIPNMNVLLILLVCLFVRKEL